MCRKWGNIGGGECWCGACVVGTSAVEIYNDNIGRAVAFGVLLVSIEVALDITGG